MRQFEIAEYTVSKASKAMLDARRYALGGHGNPKFEVVEWLMTGDGPDDDIKIGDFMFSGSEWAAVGHAENAAHTAVHDRRARRARVRVRNHVVFSVWRDASGKVKSRTTRKK